MLAEDVLNDWEEYDSNMSKNIFLLEKELGVYITDEYPLAKMVNQLTELQNYQEAEKREYDKSKTKRGLR